MAALGTILTTGDLIFFLATDTREGHTSIGQDNTDDENITSLLLLKGRTHTRGNMEGEETTITTLPLPLPLPLPPLPAVISLDTSNIAQDISSVNVKSFPVDLTNTRCTTPESVFTVYKASTLPHAEAKMTGM